MYVQRYITEASGSDCGYHDGREDQGKGTLSDKHMARVSSTTAVTQSHENPALV